MRTQESITKDLRTGNFVTSPGDIFIVKHTSNLISNSIVVELKNGNENFYFGLPNKIEAWNFLKELNEIGGRKVLYQIDDNEPFDFADSMPYKYRFN